jgi:hypothetical protein
MSETGGTVWDAPNQQVVRADQSHPAQEGTGGTGRQDVPETASDETTGEQTDLDGMTKAELLEYARSLDVSPANNDMTKEELRAAVDAKLAER